MKRKRLLTLVVVAILAVGLVPIGRQFYAGWRYRAAVAAANRKDFTTAQRHFDKCLTIWSQSAETHFQAARNARRAGDLETAARLLADAKRLNWVPNAVLLEESLLKVQRGDFRSVAGYLVSCVRRDHPDTLYILEVIVPAFAREFDLPSAAEGLDRWIALDPTAVTALLLKGDLAERVRNKNIALEAFRQAVKLAPDNPEARLRCGLILIDVKQNEEAKQHFDWLMERQPNDPKVRLGTARCLIGLGEEEAGRRMLAQYLDEFPDDPAALAQRGQLELDADRPDEAEPWLRKAAARNPFELDLIYNIARCLDRLGKSEEANSWRERLKKAEADYQRMTNVVKEISNRPHDPALRLEAGLILMRNGQELEGKRWLESALREDPNHAASHRGLADYFDRIGDPARAAEHRKLAQAALFSPPTNR
jgi:tetratricopeptide (TPR) repeat protein